MMAIALVMMMKKSLLSCPNKLIFHILSYIVHTLYGDPVILVISAEKLLKSLPL